jgi:ATP-binding cassette subfamily B protein
LLALIFTASSVLGMGHGLRYLVDEGLGKSDPDLLDRGFYVLLGVVGMLAIASYARSYFISRVGEQVVADIRKDVFHHVIMLSPGFFETTRTGEILSRLTTDTTLLQAVVGNTVTFALRNLLLLIGGTTLLLITSLKLTGLVFLMIPLVVVPIITLGKKVRRLSRETQDKVADLSVHIEETLSSLRTVQAYSLEARRSDEFGDKVGLSLDVACRRIATRSVLTSLVITMVFGAISAVLWMGGRDVLAGNISAGELSSFVFYAVVVAAAVGAISEIMGDLQRAAGAAERLGELLKATSPVEVPAKPRELPIPLQGNLRFDHVTFHYPTRPDTASLRAFNLEVPAGKRLALVGPSGAGKTTVIQLLLRFYDPQEGKIFLDDVPIDTLDPVVLRGQIGLVPQDPVIFSANAWENIRCGRPDASDEEVLQAARAAAAMEFLEALPDGLGSYLGEKGIRLSGGQKQRIAIARAILKNPKILLLDEATSALDSENEKLVQHALERVMENRTTLMIAHRLSTIRKADEIIVMDQGSQVSRGTHEALIHEEDGLYARLARQQFAA